MCFDYCLLHAKQIVKGIDAVTREQLVRAMALLGFGNALPVFSMVPSFGLFKPAGLLPTITEEDRVILNNVQTVVEFLAAGSSISRMSNQVFTVNPLLENLLGECLHMKFLKNPTLTLCWYRTCAGIKCVSGYPRVSSCFAKYLFQSAPWSAEPIIITGNSTCD